MRTIKDGDDSDMVGPCFMTEGYYYAASNGLSFLRRRASSA